MVTQNSDELERLVMQRTEQALGRQQMQIMVLSAQLELASRPSEPATQPAAEPPVEDTL